MNRLLLLVAISGCASSSSSMRATQRRFCEPVPNASVVCFYRNQAAASNVDVELMVDERNIASISNDHFIEVVVAPGQHRAGAWLRIPIAPSLRDIRLQAGEVRYFDIEMQPLLLNIWGPTLKEIDAGTARHSIDEDCQRTPGVDLNAEPPIPPVPGAPTSM